MKERAIPVEPFENNDTIMNRSQGAKGEHWI
jgi:hypothetical protein